MTRGNDQGRVRGTISDGRCAFGDGDFLQRPNCGSHLLLGIMGSRRNLRSIPYRGGFRVMVPTA